MILTPLPADFVDESTPNRPLWCHTNTSLVSFLGSFLLQLYLISNDNVLVSLAPTQFSKDVGWLRPLPLEGGRPVVQDDKAPPSRAYRKLEEVTCLDIRINLETKYSQRLQCHQFHMLRLQILAMLTNPVTGTSLVTRGSLCVDLGSAPGGWTRKLLSASMVSLIRILLPTPCDEYI